MQNLVLLMHNVNTATAKTFSQANSVVHTFKSKENKCILYILN